MALALLAYDPLFLFELVALPVGFVILLAVTGR
jgi:hypothetical protein